MTMHSRGRLDSYPIASDGVSDSPSETLIGPPASAGGPRRKNDPLRRTLQRLLGRESPRAKLPGWLAGASLALLPVAALAIGVYQDRSETEPPQPVTVLRSEAVALAEEFVCANGYTDAPHTQDLDQITLESIEGSSELAAILRERRGTLLPRAYGVSRSEHGWTVGFRHREGPATVGRAVTLNAFGKNLRMQHQGFMLSALETRLASVEVDPDEAPPARRWISVGRVTDREGRGIPGASVRVATGVGTLLGGGSTTAGPDGEYALEFGEGIFTTEPDSPNRQIAWFFVEASGFVEWTRTKSEHLTMARFHQKTEDYDSLVSEPDLIIANAPYRIDFVLTRPATLLVDVVDEQGNPIEEAGLALDESNQTSKAHGADQERGEARYAWDVRPEMSWTLSIPSDQKRFRTHTDAIVPKAPGRYHITLRSTGSAPGQRALSIIRLTDDDGRDVRSEVLLLAPGAQPPLDEPGQLEARAVVERVLEANRYWLKELPPGIQSYSYRLGERVIESTSPDARTPKHTSLLHQLGEHLDDVTFRFHRVEGDTITLAYSLKEPLRVDAGNGIAAAGTPYAGYVSTSAREGVLSIDATLWAPLEHSQGKIQETFSRYRSLGDGHVVPLKIEIQGKMKFRWEFEVYEPGLWIVKLIPGTAVIPQVTDVHVNGRPAALKDQ